MSAPLPRFSQVLRGRRQELRLTTNQAARNLRLKEEVLLAFEAGDWSRIPRSGYAQGMLSSYARYLGLNPSEVIYLFQEDFEIYSAGGLPAGDGARGDAGESTGRVRGRGRASRGDLYGSQGPAGSMLSGSIEDARVYGESAATRATPLSGSAKYGYSQKYLNASSARPEDTSYTHRNLYTKSTSNAVRRRGRTSQEPIRDEFSYAQAQESDVRFQTGEIRTREVQSQMFSDDLHYDPARPYEQASTAAGRRASKNIAKPTRPNVQRRSSSQGLPGAGGGGGGSAPGDGQKQPFFSNTRRTIMIAFLVVAAILLLLITLGIRGCVSRMASNNQPDEIANPQAQTQNSSDNQSDTANTNNSYVEVKVEVLQGDVTWLEIKNDTVTDVAQTITGPWSKTYQVTGTMQVRAAEATAVTITANGKTVSFDKASAGLSVATINAKDYGVTAPATTNGSATANNSNTSGSGSNNANTSTGSSNNASTSAGSSNNANTSPGGSNTSNASDSTSSGTNTKE